VERIDYSAFDLLLLGGDYTWQGTGARQTVAYLDTVFNLSAASTLAALGNHDTSNKSYFTDETGRPAYYAFKTNGITFVVLDTTDDSQNILGGELQMLQDTINTLSNSTHLVVVHHHTIWLADYPPLAHLKGTSDRRQLGQSFRPEFLRHRLPAAVAGSKQWGGGLVPSRRPHR
jgi:predicted MPP superfamily phosphohydrolase